VWLLRLYASFPTIYTRIGRDPKPPKGVGFPDPLSGTLNPIELAFAKFKTGLRKAAERTVDDLWRRIGVLIDDFSPQECQNYFCHDGYAST